MPSASSSLHSLQTLQSFAPTPSRLTRPIYTPDFVPVYCLHQFIMQWLDRSRWTTAPFYAAVIFIIACGTIPKGMWRVAHGRNHNNELPAN